MRILYAFQGTGNGHMARAQEIVPILRKYAQVDTLLSGHQSQLKADFEINYQHKGISLLYNSRGALSYKKILTGNNFLAAARAIGELDLKQYELIINDFEPLTAWACKLRNMPFIELSHQASFQFAETPKPKKKDFLGNWVLKYYVPSKTKIGFHFESYHPQIKKPVIRKKIRQLQPYNSGHYVVYLPSYSDKLLFEVLKMIPVNWKVFSRHCSKAYSIHNMDVYPIDEQYYLKYFASCEGILCNAGFETPAEALFLGKKLFVIPIQHQYEQECNAYALETLGIPCSKFLNTADIARWVASDNRIQVDYPDNIEDTILNDVLKISV